MAKLFHLEIREQHWIGPLPGGRYEDGSVDWCSHGSIYCELGGTVVTTDEPEYGISQSALSLLRSVELDHPTKTDLFPMPGYLLGHGCGYPIALGCDNFGTDWRVQHDGDDVVISDAVLTDARGSVGFDMRVRLPLTEYADQIVAFARVARRFYFADGPRRVDPSEVHFHDQVWAEFDARLKSAELLLE